MYQRSLKILTAVVNAKTVQAALNDTTRKALQAYVDDILAKLKNLHQAALQFGKVEGEHKKREAEEPFEGGIPEAPDMDGENAIPDAPPL